VGSMRDLLARYYAEQSTSGARLILRTDGAGKYWLEGDGTKWLQWTANSPFAQVTIASGCRRTGGTTAALLGRAGDDIAGGFDLGVSDAARMRVRTAGANT